MTKSTQHGRALAALATLALALPGAADGADLDGSGYYPHHKPIRGDYPGTYTRITGAPPAQPVDGFDWSAAGAGAAATLGAVLLSTALRGARLRAKRRPLAAPVASQLPDH
jgi:hypothetical protein